MRARLVLVLASNALLALGCSYDYSNVPLAPEPDAGGGGGVDAGPRFSCDPIGQTCPVMQHCGLLSDPSGEHAARCVLAGGRGMASAPCDGPDTCAPGFYCWSTAGGSSSCQSFCTDLSPSCADGRTCDRSSVLFRVGANAAYACR